MFLKHKPDHELATALNLWRHSSGYELLSKLSSMTLKELENQAPTSFSVPLPFSTLALTLHFGYTRLYHTILRIQFPHFCLWSCCCSYKNLIFLFDTFKSHQMSRQCKSLQSFYLCPIHLHSNHFHVKNCSPFNCSYIWCLDL